MENNQKGTSVEIEIPTTLTVKFNYDECMYIYGESIAQVVSQDIANYIGEEENWSDFVVDVNEYIKAGVGVDSGGVADKVLSIKLKSNKKAKI